MPQYFLGVDIGGTKSHALISDEHGHALGFGEAGAGNHEVVGWKGLARVLANITGQALTQAGLGIEQIAGAGFGVAGYDWPSEYEPTRRAVEPLGLNAPFEIVNDTIVGLLAGARGGWGVAVVAGTSNNCRGWDQNRREGRVTGHGPRFGEYGGSSEMVTKAVHNVVAEWTCRGPATQLTQAFIEWVGAKDREDLIEGLCNGRYFIDADAAALVFEVAEKGDQVARETIAWAGRELGSLANGVIRQIGIEALDFDVVLVGSLYKGGSLLIEPMRETIQALAPHARLVPLSAPPVVGGVLLGMEQAGMAPFSIREALIASTNALLSGRS